ncbi:hypothetical protein ACPCBF_24515 [Streptomyces pseudogriseolus]|uniref:hypothetical protein n=1 Tax=Streptomyces pseudogriseolus TaxID=36817 RepID=UPI003FA2EB90
MITVDLVKRRGQYLVIADDQDAFTNWAEYMREDRLPERRVVHVERQADQPDEREAQWDELSGSVLDAGSESLSLLTVSADSHAHAAAIVRHQYAVHHAAVRMVEAIDSHLERGVHGWVAIRIADGGSDGELYGDYEEAIAAQERPEECTYVPVSPAYAWTPRMCEEYLEGMTHLRHGCMVYGRPTCR